MRTKRWVNPNLLEPEYVIINESSQVFIGLIGGYPDWSDDLSKAKTFKGQSIFDTLKRYSDSKIEQLFL